MAIFLPHPHIGWLLAFLPTYLCGVTYFPRLEHHDDIAWTLDILAAT